jgi:manganese/zinc/iron transport system substrate-binding protein
MHRSVHSRRLLVPWLLLGWAAAAVGAVAGPYRIVTTVGMLTDVTRAVAGDRAEVRGLIGEGVDPHLYKPTRGDVVAIMQADVVLHVGLMLEGKMAELLGRAARNGRTVRAVGEAIPAEKRLGGGHPDPHVWMDASLWSDVVAEVARVLSGHDPAGRADYEARAAEYRKRLADLDAYVRRIAATVPAERRVLVTAHDAFGYFGRAYGIEVRGVQGISTESEAGLHDVNRLVDLLVTRRISAVFVETSVAEKNVRALLEGARSRGHEVRVGGLLFSDAMGPAGTYEGTYIGMIDHNATVIVRALGGEAPERGMQGRLGVKP